MTEDGQLLRQYARQGSQAAFSQIVARHLNLVYSVCLREVRDAALAEDVTQVVFLLLARKAPALGPDTRLTGWLFHTARFACKNALRREARRRIQEQGAGERMLESHDENALWDSIGPGLNDALASLGAKDREAVLLRFADGLSFPELGTALGTSEDAARMRLNRAVERLRRFFAKEGVTLSGAALIGLLADRAVQAAPATCAASVMRVAGSVVAGGGSAGPFTFVSHSLNTLKGALQAMTTAKRWATLVAFLLIGTAGMVFRDLKHPVAQAQGADQEGQDAATLSDPLSPNPSVRDRALQHRIEQAKLLRARWQPWAEKHSNLLRQMLDAQPGDIGPLLRVYEAIPAMPDVNGRSQGAGITHDDLHMLGALFTWNTISRGPIQKPLGPATMGQIAESNAWFRKRMRDDFAQYHDFRLCESANTGRSHVVLWASGRTMVMVDQDKFAGHGKSIETYEVADEVEPVYDFLL